MTAAMSMAGVMLAPAEVLLVVAARHTGKLHVLMLNAKMMLLKTIRAIATTRKLLLIKDMLMIMKKKSITM